MRGCDIRAGAKAGINKRSITQTIESSFVFGSALGLHEDRPIPGQSEPIEVLENSIDIFLAASRLVEVLNAKPEFVAASAGHHGAVSMPQVQPASRGRRETRNLHLAPS